MVQNRTCRLLLVNRDLLITLLTPLLLSPIPIVYKTAASKCLYMFLVMLVYILTEAIPLAMIGLLPAATFPLLGLMDAATLGKAYFTDQILFVIGVLTISTAVERTDLHKRIVLRSLLVFGSSPYGILFGIFLISGFLSMWLPNTAMVSMMMPIGVALGEQLDRQLGRPFRTSKLTGYTNAQYQGEGTEDTEPEVKELGDVKKDPAVFATGSSVNILKDFDATEEDNDNGTDGNDVNKKSALTRCLLLSIAYGNTIGGSATMIGTIVPIIANAQLMRIYGPSSVVEFDLWIQFGFPLQLASLLCAYVWMAFIMSRKMKKMRKSRGDSSSVESAAPRRMNPTSRPTQKIM
ncbi:solute carrier family 13 member 1-like [Ptychodera flava]|uniref:solute carrier family 13 member 1-like n=1 Tax=Ptychodera flava TaxID=63121 RepID=UPI00396A4E70